MLWHLLRQPAITIATIITVLFTVIAIIVGPTIIVVVITTGLTAIVTPPIKLATI